jgi:hypothetical protein
MREVVMIPYVTQVLVLAWMWGERSATKAGKHG